MKKYLISSNYHYYDDFAFCNVCICDTREQAEELVETFKKNIDKFVERKGILIYITKEDFTDIYSTNRIGLHDNFIDFEYNKELVCINHNNVILFLEDEDNLEKIKRDKIYYVESNYFHFLTLNRDRDTLEKRYCHHEEANLEIEELEYLGLE